MSAEHLSKGSVCPATVPAVLRCYSMKYCPYAQRTRLVLVAKNVKHDIVNVNLTDKPEWLVSKNSMEKVPVLEHNGTTISESLITCDMLDELYPNPPLYPADPWLKARDRVYVELFNNVISTFFKILLSKDTSMIGQIMVDLKCGLEVFEKELSQRGTTFFGGDQPGMLDLMIWPWFERIPILESSSGEDLKLTPERFNKLISWMQHMNADPTVEAVLIGTEEHVQFFMHRKSANPNYDFALENKL